MWLVFALIHVFLLALVNYIDEYLTRNNKLPKTTTIHTRIGGLLLVSTLLSFVGAAVIGISLGNIEISQTAFVLAILSSLMMVVMFAAYFYLLTLYPVYQVLPLFQISSIWLLCIELFFGGTITLIGFLGVVVLMVGAYVLDSGTFKWQIPTKLLLIMIPSTLPWALALFLVRFASETTSPAVITFWQMVGIGGIGILLFVFAKTYREGFLFRIRKQGRNFLGFSFINESLSQGSYLFGNVAVSLAPIATYVTAISGVQSIFLLALFYLFPQTDKTKITRNQTIAIFLIALGIFLIEAAS